MSLEITGKIKVINPEQQVSASFVKREIVVSTEENYPQHILIEFHQDKCDLVDPYQIGETVKVSINLRGREWVNPQGETRYFNSIQGWKIERLSVASTQAPMSTAQNFAPATNLNDDEIDDLPY